MQTGNKTKKHNLLASADY